MFSEYLISLARCYLAAPYDSREEKALERALLCACRRHRVDPDTLLCSVFVRQVEASSESRVGRGAS